MLLHWLNLLSGWYLICGQRLQAAEFLNLCMRKGIHYWNFAYAEDVFFICVRRRTWRMLCAEAERCGIFLTVEKEYGLPCRLRPYRRRWGLILGTILAVLIIVVSGRFVWRIEVIGTEQYQPRDVIEELLAEDFGIGSYIPQVDVNALQNRILMNSKRFAWLSVNLIGTTARVEVIEQKTRLMPQNNHAPANLVAAADGQIVRFSLRDGWESVAVGDVVRAGELLVSGIGERKDGGTQLVCANGQVYAEVMHELSAEIPLEYSRKVFSGQKITEKSIIFFGNEIKLSQKTGILGGSCDTIDNERILTFFGQITVPVIFCSRTHLFYREEPARRSVAEALALAEYTLRLQTDALSADRELLRMTRSTTVTEAAVRLDCTLFCIENIARQEPIMLGSAEQTS